MTLLAPRIYGLRLAAGIILWLAAFLTAVLAALLWPNDPAGELPLLLLAIAAALGAIAYGFWRGNRVARWLAVIPGLGLFFAAFVWWALSGLCVAAAPLEFGEPVTALALSCPEPRPERSLLSWVVTALLGAAGIVVFGGVFRPGVREA